MDSTQSHVDVLIIGAGPSGLSLANWFNGSGLQVRIIDNKAHPIQRGQAEGLKSITTEIFDSFGIGRRIWAEVWRLEEIVIWGPDEEGQLKRLTVVPDWVPELRKPREVILGQARVEHHLIKNLEVKRTCKVEWSTKPVALALDESLIDDPNAYPVLVELPGDNIRARYVVGCDGAHSWTRQQLGIKLEGKLTDAVFGCVDIVPKTNFPDIRKVCYIRSPSGTILVIPRYNKEVRLYIPVENGTALSDPKQILSAEKIIEAGRKILHPYRLDYGECRWWSAYRVSQKTAARFSAHNRVFLVGDAIHTHSPKAGQGMNTSIQDANNLGWKLRLVLTRRASSQILETYEAERRPVAEDVVNFDHDYLPLFTGKSENFDSVFFPGLKFTTGLSIRYESSALVRLTEEQARRRGQSLLKSDLVPGKRLPDFQVVTHADATPIRIHSRLTANGCFRLIIFAGNISQPDAFDRLKGVCDWLSGPRGLGSLCHGATPLVEVLVIHTALRADVELLEMPEILRPWSEAEGIDYWRVYVDEESVHDGHGNVYEWLDVSREKGVMTIVRPDGYVGALLGFEDKECVRQYFHGIVVGASTRESKL